MSRPERLWLILNVQKDQELENQKFKVMLMHMLPQAYVAQEEEEATISTEYVKEIEEKLGRPLTKEELEAISQDQDIDFIG